MRRIVRAVLCAGSAILPISPPSVGAQWLPSRVDSLGIDLSSRLVWRALDRGRGLSARSQLSVGLLGFTIDQSGRNNLTLEAENWFPIADRKSRRLYDQTRAAVRYGRCIVACDRTAWSRQGVLSLELAEYYRPHASIDRTTTELLASVGGEWQVEALRGHQFGGLFYPYILGAWDPGSAQRTYARAGLGTQTPSIHGLSAFIGANVAASDYPTRSGAKREFGYHSWGGIAALTGEIPLKEFRKLAIRLQASGNRLRGSLGRSSIEHGIFLKIY